MQEKTARLEWVLRYNTFRLQMQKQAEISFKFTKLSIKS